MKKVFSFFGSLILFVITTSSQAQSKEAGWKIIHTKNIITDRGECGMAAADGKLYLLGGTGQSPVEVFAPVTSAWTKKALAPVEMHHFQPVTYKNNIYVLAAFSGGTGYPNQYNLKNVHIYNIAKDEWTLGAPLPANRNRAAAGAALYKGKIYLVAGIKNGHNNGTTNFFDVYDPQTDQWSALPDAPHIRDHCAAAVIGDNLYIAGGRNTSYHEPENFRAFFSHTILEVDCYDFEKGEWTTLDARLPLGTGGGSMVNFNDELYYMGGERATDTEANQPRKNVYRLNPANGNGWTPMPDLLVPRNGMSAAVLPDHIYVFGGAGSIVFNSAAPLEVFTTK